MSYLILCYQPKLFVIFTATGRFQVLFCTYKAMPEHGCQPYKKEESQQPLCAFTDKSSRTNLQQRTEYK